MDAADRSIILDAQDDLATLKIGQRHDLFRQLLRANVIALELDPRVLTVGYQLQKL